MVSAMQAKQIGAATVCACLLVVCAYGADTVVTFKERLEGALALKDGQFQIADKIIPWDSVSYILRGDAPATITSSRVIRMKNGERWSAEISGLVSKKLTLDAPAFGTQRVDVAQIAAIDFMQNLEWDSSAKPTTLYRERAQPIPGELLWIDRDKLSLKTSLGTLTLQREGIERYVFSTPIQDSADALDAIALRDGSIFKGKVALNGANLELTHAQVGKLSFPLSALRYVLRNSATIANIRGFSAEQVQFTPLISTQMLPEAVRDPSGIWGIRIWPRTVVKYPLPENHEKIVFRTLLSCQTEASGHARVRILAGGKTLFEKVVADKAEWISIEVSKMKELEIEVNYEGSPRFPADIVLNEPQLVFE